MSEKISRPSGLLRFISVHHTTVAQSVIMCFVPEGWKAVGGCIECISNSMDAQCCGLNVCIHQNSQVEVLLSNVMIVGGEAFGRQLGHECRALMNGLNAILRRDRREMIPASVM